MTTLTNFFLVLCCSALTISQELPLDLRDELVFTSNFDIGNRGSFGTVVTPEPLDPNAPTFASIHRGTQCRCVVYYECDPANSPQSTLSNRVEIDLRQNTDTPCSETLDVCCRDGPVSQRPTSPPQVIVPTARPPVTQRPIDNNQPNQITSKPVATGCGVRMVGGLDFTIVGDFNNEAGYGEFPWTGALMHKEDSRYVCGASLIHPSVALTSNHCTKFILQNGDASITRVLQSTTQPADLFKVRFGEWDTQTTKERWPYQERLISQIIGHPQYSSKSLANDVALLVLERPIDSAAHINVVCLPPATFVASSPDCFANGWGRNEFGSQNTLASILKRVPLGMIDSTTCQSQLRSTRLGNRFRLDPSFVCAGGVKGIDTCTGDGGAPLVCPVGPQKEYRYVQVGSVAWGIGCKDNIPGVYSNMASFRGWIDEIMNGLGFGTSSYTY